MNFTARADRRLFGPNGSLHHIWVHIDVPRRASTSSRLPLDVALVLDRSGSMAGSKLDLVRQAASGVLRHLRDTDRCALVSYDDVVEVPVEGAPVNPAQQQRLASALSGLYGRGMTDLFGGWMAGAEQIGEASDGRICRVVLLTDGLANRGVTDNTEIIEHVRQLAMRGIGTTTFGVGLDFNEFLVSGMADAGNGHFYYLERPEQILEDLAQEFEELLVIAAEASRIRHSAPAHVVVTCINELPMRDGQYDLGDLSEGAAVDLCFAVEVPAGQAATINIDLEFSWRDAASGDARLEHALVELCPASEEERAAEQLDKEAVIIAVSTRSAKAQKHALAMNDSGDYRGARSLAEEEATVLREVAGDVVPR